MTTRNSKCRRHSSARPILIFALLLIVLAAGQAFALTDHIVFSINGDTSVVNMVQGEELSWAANCAVGATMTWEIWYDVNADSAIQEGQDKLVVSYDIADGQTESNGAPPDTNPTPDGEYVSPPMALGIAPGLYVFRVTDQSDLSTATRAKLVTALPSPPNEFVGRITVEGHPAPDAAVLQWVWVEADADDGQMWSAMTDENGDFTINVGATGTDVTFWIEPKDIPGFVRPAEQQETASGTVNLADFAYAAPADSVYGDIVDEHGSPIAGMIYVWASPSPYGGTGKNVDAVNGSYVMYFGPSELGEWMVGLGTDDLIPSYMVPGSVTIDNSSDHGINQDFVCLTADTVIYAVVTEDGGVPAHQYRIQAMHDSTDAWTEVISQVGSSDPIALHISSTYDSGWMAYPVDWDTEYPIPEGFILEGTTSNLNPGDTAYLNFYVGAMVRDTVKVDPGDQIPDWDSVQVYLSDGFWGYPATIDNGGVFTAYVDTGSYTLGISAQGYIASPVQRAVHVTGDTVGGMGIELNQTHCRIHGMLQNTPMPLPDPTYVTVSFGMLSWTADVDPATGEYSFNVCDGAWIVWPPPVADRETPDSVAINIGEAPDTARTVNFTYSVVAGIGDGSSDGLPTTFELAQNYPNPFNPTTSISFSLPERGQVRLAVYNLLGRKVVTLVDGEMSGGIHTVEWDGKDSQGAPCASGVYFYRMTSSDFVDTRKMLFLK